MTQLLHYHRQFGPFRVRPEAGSDKSGLISAKTIVPVTSPTLLMRPSQLVFRFVFR
jgi:hypothetical protein